MLGTSRVDTAPTAPHAGELSRHQPPTGLGDAGHVPGVVGPDTQSFTYYPNGRLDTETGRGAAATIKRVYDPAGNVVSVRSGADAVTGTYYLDGLPRTVTSGGYVSSFAYDGAAP